jgi:hypothetical protein
MELNSVAPYRRAESMNVLAENPGNSTRLARAATEPRVEYAGALMWNNGSGRHETVVGGELHPVRKPFAGHDVRAVRLHHELGASGGARSRDHHRDRVGFEVGRSPTVRDGTEEVIDGNDCRGRAHDGREFRVGDDQLWFDLTRETSDLGVGAGGVDRPPVSHRPP